MTPAEIEAYTRGVNEGYAAARRPCRHGVPRALCQVRCAACSHGCIDHYWDGRVCQHTGCNGSCEWVEPTTELKEGTVHKGGQNPSYQIAVRPPDPPPMKAPPVPRLCLACEDVRQSVKEHRLPNLSISHTCKAPWRGV